MSARAAANAARPSSEQASNTSGAQTPHSKVRFYTGCELAAMKVEEPEAICEGLIYKGCSSDLIGEVKRGKTTLALSMAAAIVRGEPFCRRPTVSTGVLYLSEQSRYSFNPQCARAGLLRQERFHVLLHPEVRSLNWRDIGELVVQRAKEHQLGVVMIDNLSLWAGISGSDENEAGFALETMRVIEQMTGAGLGVLSLRHTRKGGGTISEAGRGSSAIAGGFDILLRLLTHTQPSRRLIEATGRVFARQPKNLLIELTDDERYVFVAEGNSTAPQDARRLILELLPDSSENAWTEARLLDACRERGVGKSTVQKELRRLVKEEPEARRLVRGEKGAGQASSRALGYWRCRDAR